MEAEAEPILSEAENLSIAQKYVAWRLGGGKEKYDANAKKQNAKKKEKSIAIQIIACRKKLDALIAKEAQRLLLTPSIASV
jgi:hypothetical protein